MWATHHPTLKTMVTLTMAMVKNPVKLLNRNYTVYEHVIQQ